MAINVVGKKRDGGTWGVAVLVSDGELEELTPDEARKLALDLNAMASLTDRPGACDA